jgi:hypothetical protein
MAAGSKIDDDRQEYQYSMPFITPSGHELSFYETPENQRVVLKHTSGSHIEFKSDGSVFIKAVKDMHMHGSVLSEDKATAGGTAKEADSTTMRWDTDLNLEVGGTLHISARRLEVDISETTNIISGTDFVNSANNITEKATENVTIEGTKSIYVDTKEYRERSVSHRVEEGTMEDKGEGGINYTNVSGNYIINNTDKNGGITIMSAGYLNLVCGNERVDLIGEYTDKPSSSAKGSFTTIIKEPSGDLDKSTMPGDYYFESDAGAYYNYAKSSGGSSGSSSDGLKQVVTKGNMQQDVTAGNRNRTVGAAETIAITGIQTVTAQLIYLN